MCERLKGVLRMNENIVDGGDRQTFDTGAVREPSTGKGRCDLLPFSVICDLDDLPNKGFYDSLIEFMDTPCESNLRGVANELIYIRGTQIEDQLLKLAVHFEKGAAKYGDNNWQKGIPVSRYVDSAVRHYLKSRRGDTDEDHASACLWNLLCGVWTIRYRPEMLDLKGGNER